MRRGDTATLRKAKHLVSLGKGIGVMCSDPGKMHAHIFAVRCSDKHTLGKDSEGAVLV